MMPCGSFGRFLLPFLFVAWAAECQLASDEGKVEKVEGPVIGIDLGTTFSCAGIYKNGVVEIIPTDQGNRLMPSVVAFATDGSVLVGEAAKLNLEPSARIFDIKRFIGQRFRDATVQRELQNMPFKIVADSDGSVAVNITRKGKVELKRPEEISALLLRQLKARAVDYLGQDVQHAVITVPAFFNDAMREAVKLAGEMAGLKVLRLLNEPTAAAVTEAQTLLVFDLGGGTCDVSILRREGDTLEVLAASGYPHLGGGDFDQKIVSHLRRAFSKKFGEVPFDEGALERLRVEAEKVKRRLSTVPQATVKLEGLVDGKDLSETLTRAQFEKLNEELFLRSLEPIKSALKDANLAKSDVNTVILAGGSARIPKVQQLLSQFFDGKELTRSINPDEVVAYGAAIHAASLTTHGSKEELQLIDVTPLSLGIQTAGGFMTTVIKRNTPLPAENMMIFSTHKDNQETATVKVFQGERLMAKNNHLLGSFQIKGISPAPRGVPQIQVFFKPRRCPGGQLDSGSGKSEVLKNAEGLSHERIEEMMKEAESFEKEDQKDFDRAEAKMKLKLFIRSLHHAAEMALEDDATTFLAAASEGEDWLAANPEAEAEEIHEKREELEGNVPEMPTAKPAGGSEIDMEGHDEL